MIITGAAKFFALGTEKVMSLILLDVIVLQYLVDLKCPLDLSQKVSVVDWLLAHAVRVEYAENGWLYFSPRMLLDFFLLNISCSCTNYFNTK